MSQYARLSARWPRALLAALCGLMILAPSPAAAGHKEPASAREFLIASVEESMEYLFWDSAVESIVYSFGMCESGWCAGMQVDLDEGDVGTPFWWTDQDANFASVTTYLTNGAPNTVERYVTERMTGNGAGAILPEPAYFGSQVGPNGIDLGGFNISRIGAVFDVISIRPDYPTHTTQWRVHGRVLFVQQATKEACKNGGWGHLKRMDGSLFKNQGDCLQYVNTGK